MRIRFQPRFGTQDIEIRDVPAELVRWHAGDEHDVPDDVAKTIFSCGGDFVDASSGKNPLFSCAACGETCDQAQVVDPSSLTSYDLVDANGRALCPTDYLVVHPELEGVFRHVGFDKAIFPVAQQRRDAAARKAPTAAPPATNDSTNTANREG